MYPLYIICMAIRTMVAINLFAVAIFLGKNAATVFLHVEPKRTSSSLPLAETNAKIAVEKFNSAHGGEFFADFDELFVFLIGRNEQCSREIIIAMLCGVADCLGEAFAITIVGTAIWNVANNVTAKLI